MIKLVNVSKAFPSSPHALVKVSLELPKDEFLFLMGPTGSGKSTLIKLLYREEVADSGDVWVDDQNVSQLNSGQVSELRQKTGVVFQDFRLLPNKTVWENVAFVLDILGTGQREKEKRIRAALELTNMFPKAQSYPSQLSGGEQQRAAIARAIVNKPPLLLADEPTGNLDPETSWDIMKLLNKINATGTTVIVASHNKPLVDQLKKRVVMMEKGKIIQDSQKGGYNKLGIS